MAEGAIEVHRVLADQGEQDGVRTLLANLVENVFVVAATEGQKHLADDAAAGFGDETVRDLMRRARPHIVVADEHPAPWTVALVEPVNGRTQLSGDRFADCEYTGRALAALVERGVHERYAAADCAQ